ncbi:helix-turn-helix transcriptional regulator [Haladaptatus sp. NG-WS-4]
MRLHSALLVVSLSLLLVGTVATTTAAHQSPPTSVDDTAVNRTAAANATEVNGTTIRLVPQPNGDARWNVTMEFPLRNENETAAFENLGQRFERGNADVAFSAELFRRISAQVETETGREMKIRQVDRSYTVGNRGGTLSLSFVWMNFMRVEGDKIILRDAFLLDDGESTWLPSLAADQQLVVEEPTRYEIQSSPNFGHRNGTIRVEGPTSLYPGEIDVTYVEDSAIERKNPFAGVEGIALILLVLGTGGAGLYVLIQRQENESVDDSSSEAPSVTSPEPDSEHEPDDEPNLELLSDEERVEHLLEQNGGRMKQAKIVTETNWSNAKVSQRLSSMADEGRIDKLRIGRENLISLPDENATDFENK